MNAFLVTADPGCPVYKAIKWVVVVTMYILS